MNIMIKPVSGRCNTDCGYCFYKEGHVCGSHMSRETITAVIDCLSVFLRGGYPLVFQGGEPLLAGHGYFKYVLEYLEARGLNLPVMVQTNGTLLDDEFARMFSRHDVLVGVSLDGTEAVHTIHRRDFRGVMRGIDCLRRHGCRFNILTVITDELCGRLGEVYEFYRREGFEYQQYIPCMAPPGKNPYLYLSQESYGRYLGELYGLWREDLNRGRYVYIRYFENLLQLLAGFMPEECGAGGVCSMQFLVESDGSVYPCDFFVDECHRLGSLCLDDREKIRRRLSASDFISSSWPLPDICRQCGCLDFCRGGCRRYRDESGAYLYCQAVKPFLTQALPDMKALLKSVTPASAAYRQSENR